MRTMIRQDTLVSLVSLITCLTVVYGVAASSAQADPARNVVRKYIEALVAERWDEAASYWAPEAIASSERLGIRYIGTHAKYDCNAPVHVWRDSIRAGRADYSTRVRGRRFDWKEIEVTVKVRIGDHKLKLKTIYYLEERDDAWRILSPLDFLSRGWSTWTTRYVRVRCQDSASVNAFSLAYVDTFVDSVLTVLGATEERRQCLEDNKIDYYLVPLEDIERFAGARVAGVAPQSYNAVVTYFLAHVHELAHVVIEFVAEEFPLFTPPFLREGAATALGGGGHMSPAVALQFGEYISERDHGYFDEILPSQDVSERVTSFVMSYTKGAVLTYCIIQSLGGPRFIDFYRRMSVPNVDQMTLERIDVMDSIKHVLNIDYDPFVQKCRGTSKAHRFSGIRPVLQTPETGAHATGRTESFTVNAWLLDSQYVFEIGGIGEEPKGALLFDCSDRENTTRFSSLLSERRFKNREYRGECLGLRFSPRWVNILNFRFDHVEAVLIPNIDSSIHAIWDEDRGTILFQVEQRILPGDILGKISRLSEP